MTHQLQVLSLGWGVQSWTLAAMMALGELEPADFLVHADTQHERAGTYAFRDRWQPWLAERGLNVVTVTGRRTEVVRQEWSGSVLIPAFTALGETGQRGQVYRQCTSEWKVRPIRRFIREQMKHRQIVRRPGVVSTILGISVDEWPRARTSDVAYITNDYPLLDLRLSRTDCQTWLTEHGLPVAPKSSCTFCPYRSLGSWRRLGIAGGRDLQEAEAVDSAIRDKRAPYALYIHPARRPLSEAVAAGVDGQLEFEFEQPCDSGACWT